MPSIKKSELRKIRHAFNHVRFPSLSEHAMHLRSLYRDNTEFREKHAENMGKVHNNRKYSPEKYKKMQMNGFRMGSDRESTLKRKQTFKDRHIIRSKRDTKQYDSSFHKRPNDYAGVVTLSDYQSL